MPRRCSATSPACPSAGRTCWPCRPATPRRTQNLRKAILAQFPLAQIAFAYARDPTPTTTLGLAAVLALPIFNGHRGDVKVAEATREQLKAEYQARLDQTDADVQDAEAELASASAEAAVLRADLPRLEAMLATRAAALARGDIDSADLPRARPDRGLQARRPGGPRACRPHGRDPARDGPLRRRPAAGRHMTRSRLIARGRDPRPHGRRQPCLSSPTAAAPTTATGASRRRPPRSPPRRSAAASCRTSPRVYGVVQADPGASRPWPRRAR